MRVEFHKILLPECDEAQWTVHQNPDGTSDLIVQTFGAKIDNYHEVLFEASKDIWGKVDADYTEEVDSHYVCFTDITPGFEESLINLLKDNLNK